MIGRLLHLGSGGPIAGNAEEQGRANSPRPILSLESVQEDIHTRNLLFPDAHALYQHRNDQVFPFSGAPGTPSAMTPSAFDFSDEVELDVRDVRVLVMQDALGPTNASLLFDSHPMPETERPGNSESRRNQPSSRKGSVSQTARPVSIHADSPLPRQGAFDRRASIHGRNPSYAETENQRLAREYREELATFSSCIFGNSELMAYKGTSTKVHVVPSDPRPAPEFTGSGLGDGRSSLGRSSMRSSKLSQSFSSQTVSPTYGSLLPGMATPSRPGDKRKVLITRLFPVSLTNEDIEVNVTPQGKFSDENTGFPFPAASEDATPRKKPQPKQRRTPMYAVVLVIQLPPPQSRMSSAIPTKSTFREPGSYNEQDFFSSSYNSTRAAGWNMSNSGVFSEATESSFSMDVEDRIDSLTRHWDIIMRTLTHLQSLTATRIHRLLKRADAASPSGQVAPISRTSSTTDRRSAEIPRVKPPKSTTKLVSLWPNCLADDVHVASEAGLARSRIVMGLSAARVITGQGRWGIWRDEAIWAAKWAAGLEKGQFLYNLLTGFLATHTDWLQALCSQSYKRRAALQRSKRSEDDMSLPARTIVISDDKMAARRLIFLLSAFLPSNQQLNPPRAHRPSVTSLGPYSNSPPTYVVPVLREESLRRKINRRSGLRRASHSRTGSQSARNSVVNPQMQLNLDRNPQQQRRASDAASIRTTTLPMPGNDLVSRKSSAATTATVMPEATMPHFTSIQRTESLMRHRPGSSSSVAADDLKRSLKRGESSNSSVGGSRPPSSGLRWGNLINGLWSPKRRDSMDEAVQPAPNELRSPVKASFSRVDRLSQMVQEASVAEEDDYVPASPRQSTDMREAITPQNRVGTGRLSFSQQDRTPDPNGAFESPVKTSINADDGVIDVDVPFPDYIASFESAISSPSSSGYLPTPALPGVDLFEQSARISIDGDTPMNAAGWLNRFHPDFALQALPPQDDILDKVRAALRTEPTPPLLSQNGTPMMERWVDVGSAIIADTTTNSIYRIVYRRLVRSKGMAEYPAAAGQGLYSGNSLTPSVLPYEAQLDEEWIEEPVLEADETLVEALEKVIYLSPDNSRDISATSSQAPAELREGEGSLDTLSEVTQLADGSLDMPRVQCKTVVLSALEETIRDVIDRRDEDGEEHTKDHRHQQKSNLLRDAVRQWANNLEAAE